MSNSPEANALFDANVLLPVPAPVAGIAGECRNPSDSDAALAGDGYPWLAALLPVPAAPECERCGAVMRLPTAAPVLWTCPTCYPEEAA
jgi:hypothetical protein